MRWIRPRYENQPVYFPDMGSIGQSLTEWDGGGLVGIDMRLLQHKATVGDVVDFYGHRLLIIDVDLPTRAYIVMADTPESNRLLMWKLAYRAWQQITGCALWIMEGLVYAPHELEEIHRRIWAEPL